MTWVKRAPRPHHCRLPIVWPWVHEGSVWRCDDCRVEWFTRADINGQLRWLASR